MFLETLCSCLAGLSQVQLHKEMQVLHYLNSSVPFLSQSVGSIHLYAKAQSRIARPFFSARHLSIRDYKRLLQKGLVTLLQKTCVKDSPAAWLVLIGCGPQLKECQFGRHFVITFKVQVWRAIQFFHSSMSVLYQFLKNRYATHLLQLLLTGVVCYKKKLLLHHPSQDWVMQDSGREVNCSPNLSLKFLRLK